jgi:hypothetical protein
MTEKEQKAAAKEFAAFWKDNVKQPLSNPTR